MSGGCAYAAPPTPISEPSNNAANWNECVMVSPFGICFCPSLRFRQTWSATLSRSFISYKIVNQVPAPNDLTIARYALCDSAQPFYVKTVSPITDTDRL